MDFQSLCNRLSALIEDLDEDNAMSHLLEVKVIVEAAISKLNGAPSVSSDSCNWCDNESTQCTNFTHDDYDDLVLCKACVLDLPQYMKDNMEHFIASYASDGLPDQIKRMDGSLKRFAKGVFEFNSTDDGEFCIAHYESLDTYKRHLEDGGDAGDGWQRQAVFSDGKKLRVETSFKVDEA